MKISQYASMAVASMVLLSMAAGCKDGDSNTNADANPDPQVNPVVGTWRLTRTTVDGVALVIGDYEMILTIHSDGTYVLFENGLETDAGTWSTQDNSATITSRGGEVTSSSYGVSDSTLTMTSTEDGYLWTNEFTRE